MFNDDNICVDSFQVGSTPIQYLSNDIPEEQMDVNIPIPEEQMDINIDDIPIPDVSIDDNELNMPNLNLPQEEIMQPQTQPLPVKSKYNIIDVFWLLNPDKDAEVNFIQIGYNLDFGNLKLNLFQLTSDSIHNNVLFLQSMKLLTTGTIYPSSAFKILNIDYDAKFTCIEQLIQNTHEDWQLNRPIVQLEKKNNEIILTITNPNTNNKKSYSYIFRDWQLKAFQTALKLTYTNGLIMRSNILKEK